MGRRKRRGVPTALRHPRCRPARRCHLGSRIRPARTTNSTIRRTGQRRTAGNTASDNALVELARTDLPQKKHPRRAMDPLIGRRCELSRIKTYWRQTHLAGRPPGGARQENGATHLPTLNNSSRDWPFPCTGDDHVKQEQHLFTRQPLTAFGLDPPLTVPIIVLSVGYFTNSQATPI